MEGSITVECELVCVGTYTEFADIRVMWSPDGGGGPLLDTATNGFPIPGPVNGLPFHESVTFGPDGSVLSWSLGLQSRFPPGSFQAFYRTDTGENFANYGHEQFFSQAVGHGNPAGTWALASVPVHSLAMDCRGSFASCSFLEVHSGRADLLTRAHLIPWRGEPLVTSDGLLPPLEGQPTCVRCQPGAEAVALIFSRQLPVLRSSALRTIPRRAVRLSARCAAARSCRSRNRAQPGSARSARCTTYSLAALWRRCQSSTKKLPAVMPRLLRLHPYCVLSNRSTKVIRALKGQLRSRQ